jgi:hypothetical protein
MEVVNARLARHVRQAVQDRLQVAPGRWAQRPRPGDSPAMAPKGESDTPRDLTLPTVIAFPGFSGSRIQACRRYED